MIQFDDVYKSFGQKEVLRGLTFTAMDGRVTGFVGPNGAGKSTAFKILLNLIPADGGEATVDHRPYVKHVEPGKSLGAYLGPNHIPAAMTGRGFLTYTADLLAVSRGGRDAYLESVGLTEAADQKIESYSLGMRQRLGVAAAFIGEPQNLLLDEPVNGLDIDGVRWLRQYLRSAADRGRCVLLSSHLLSELEMVADDVVMLGVGKVTRSGRLDELRSDNRDIVAVTSEDNRALESDLRSGGLVVQAAEGVLHVTHSSTNEVAAVAAASSVPLVSISRLTRRLEDVYLEQVRSDEQLNGAEGVQR